MAVLGLNEIQKLIKEKQLIQNISPRDLNNPEGCGIDLRFGSIHEIIKGGAFINADDEKSLGFRKGVETKELANFKNNGNKDIILTPNEYYLIQTIEIINTPPNLMPLIYPRSSMFRAGLSLQYNKVDPGYSGILTFGLINLSKFDVTLQLGARICNIVFFEIKGISPLYKGQHQGGRVTAVNIERQV